MPTVADWALLAYPEADYRREVFTAWDAAVERAVTETGRVEDCTSDPTYESLSCHSRMNRRRPGQPPPAPDPGG